MTNDYSKDFLIYFIFSFVILFLIIFSIVFYPFVYDKFFGNKILENHIKEVLENKTDHKEAVPILLSWIHENIYYPSKEEGLLTLDNGFGIYYINKSIRLFHRGIPASWVIKSKLGRCGEDAQYFMEIMERLGYKTRKLKPTDWDHSWNEYYTEEGYKILVDPSSFQIIKNPKEWGANANWTKIEAIDINGDIEDVSYEYR